MHQPVKLFYSYSHKDEELRDELEKHLTQLRRNGLIENWHDRKIGAGNDWDQVISDHLLSADIVLFLISVDFIASEYCNDVEVKTALDQHAKGESKCIPIFLRECNFANTPFAQLQGLPDDAKFVTSKTYWNNTDEPFTHIARGIEDAIKEIIFRRKSPVQSTNPIAEQDTDEDILASMKLFLDKKLTSKSTEEEVKVLKDLKRKLSEKFDFVHEQITETPALLEKSYLDLFDVIYTTEILSKNLRDEISDIRSNEKYQWYHRSLIVSALILSLIHFKKVDQYKILLLIDFVNTEENKVWQKAITGLTVALIYRKNSWIKFPLVVERLRNLQSNSNVQSALHVIGFILERSIYNLYFPSGNIFEIDYFKEKTANCFIPFYAKNKAADFFLDHTSVESPENVLDYLYESPFPDMLKYYFCYTEYKESSVSQHPGVRKELITIIVNASSFFHPYMQYLYELYMFFNYYPSEQKELVFTEQLTFANATLKDYLLNEVEKHRVAAMHFMSKKEFGNAVSHFKSLLRYKPTDIESLENMAVCFEQIRYHYKDLLETRLEIEKNDAGNLFNLLEISNIYLRLGNRDKAIDYCKKTEAVELKKSRLYDSRAGIWLGLRNRDKALSDVNRAIQLDSENLNAYLMRSRILMETSQTEEALADLDKAKSIDPLNSDVFVTKGLVLRAKDRYTEALESFNEAHRLDSKKYSTLVYRSAIYSHFKMYKQCFEDLEAAIEIDPKNYFAFLIRGIVNNKLRNKEIALKDIAKAIELNEGDSELYLRRGQVYANMKRYDLALADVNKAIEIDPENEEIFGIRGLIKTRLSQYDDALVDLNKALEINPKNESVREFRVLNYRIQYKFEEAFNEAEAILKVNPNNVPALLSQGLVLKNKKKISEAREKYELALNILPSEFDAVYGLANTYRLTGRVEDAMNLLKTHTKPLFDENDQIILDNDTSGYYSCLAEIYSSMNNDEEFFQNMSIAFELATAEIDLSLADMEVDIVTRYQGNSRFTELCKKFNVK